MSHLLSMNTILQSIDRSLTFKQVLWLVPVVLTLHNIEEALTMPRWVMQNLPFIQSNLPFDIQVHFTPSQLLLSLGIATVVPIAVTMLCINGEKKSKRLFVLFLLQAIILINVFVPHIAVSLWILNYNPGVLTAVCFNLPFSLYLFRRAYREDYLSRREIASLFLVAFFVYPPIAWTIHFVGEWITKGF
jgi:hypothetical protein